MDAFLLTEKPHTEAPQVLPRKAQCPAPARGRQTARTPHSKKRRPLTPPSHAPTLRRPPPSSTARLPRRAHSKLLQIITEEGDPDKDSIPQEGPYVSLVPTTSPWNTLGTDMIGVHYPSGAATSPTLISPQRYGWLHAAHSRLNQDTDFLQDLQSLMLRYHPRASTVNPQGRKYKPANRNGPHQRIPVQRSRVGSNFAIHAAPAKRSNARKMLACEELAGEGSSAGKGDPAAVTAVFTSLACW